MGDFYSKLSDINLLRRGWHLARNNSRTDFMFDALRFADYAINLDHHLKGLAHSLASNSYHPQPLLTIDVPKSSLSVRPGSVLAIEDKIVLFATVCMIAPVLDKRLSESVYSWRVKRDSKGKELFQVFEEDEILRFPFLKRSTIQKNVEIVEPWYNAWPQFIEDLEYSYEKEGYDHLVVSDIVSYFENLDLGLLRDLLLRHLPYQPRIVNFLMSLLRYWSWPALYGAIAPRGIPQGNAISSFLGNIYLLPLDMAILKLAKKRRLKYLRYMDDVKVLAKDLPSAREALFLLNEELRCLRLNIQGSKTRILHGKDIRSEFIDDRLLKVNELMERVRTMPTISPRDRKSFVSELKGHARLVKGKKDIVKDKELRLLRRIITGMTLLRHSGIVPMVLDQLERNPDARLLSSAVRYLRVQDRSVKRIAARIVGILSDQKGMFPYQEASLLMILRYMPNIPHAAWRYALQVCNAKTSHWYVRQQAVLLLEQKKLRPGELSGFLKMFSEERHPEVKRGWLRLLAQLPREYFEPLSTELLFEADPKVQRVGRHYLLLLTDPKAAKAQIESIFNQFSEDVLLDRLYEVEVLAKAQQDDVRKALSDALRKVRSKLRRTVLKEKVSSLLSPVPVSASE